MKKLILIVALFLNGCASNFVNYNIKQNDKVKQIQVSQNGENYVTSKKYSFKNNTNLVIKFKTITPELINDFETTYNLQLVKIMITGGYIYSHNSTNILETIEVIVSEENVLSVSPLWKKSITLY